MRAVWRSAVWVCLAALAASADCQPQAPCYSAAGVVNAVSYQPGALAPYGYASIFGEKLSNTTGARPGDRREFTWGGVSVLVNGYSATVFYVSPGQVNFLVPSVFVPGPVTVQLAREGTLGPAVPVTLSEYAPALFPLDAKTVLAVRQPAWTIVTPENPARSGDWMALYATGLGRTVLPLPVNDYEPPRTANGIVARNQFQILLNEVAVENDRISYVGVAPGFCGVYQINFRLPEMLPANPVEIRIAVAGQTSPGGLRLPVE